jgi:DNA-binding NarL/FixJ family response regulator
VKTLILLEEEQDFWNAMSFEADGYELRQMPTYQLFAAIKAIGEGYAWIGPLLSRYLLKRAGRDCLISASQVQPSIDRASFGLSVREKEILTLLSEGLSGLKIAERLSISPKTVKLHISNCIRKMDVDDRSQAIAKFLRARR